MTKLISTTHQTGSKNKIARVIGTESTTAVDAASCCGDKFFRESMKKAVSYKLQAISLIPFLWYFFALQFLCCFKFVKLLQQ